MTWGFNSDGQLGDGTTVERHTPVTAAGVTTAGVASVAAGSAHNLALLSNGTVEAWGDNTRGQLGDGEIGTDNLTPGTVADLAGVEAVSTGLAHSLALLSDGTVMAWGDNTVGQLGIGTVGGVEPRPVPVPGLTGVRAIVAGDLHSLALLSDGTVRAWGFNNDGELGDGTVNVSGTPVTVVGPGGAGVLGGVRRIAAGSFHSLALLSDGTVRAWGENFDGQLGDGTVNDALTPVTVVGPGGAGVLGGVRRIAAGGLHSLALLSDGTVRAWGDNSSGQLGNGDKPNDSDTPVTVVGLNGVFAIAAGGLHSLALASNQPVKAWGENGAGQLGDGNAPNDSDTPVSIRTGVSGLVSISAGSNHSIAA
ncbi:RCC1 domain-containing protein [Streptosporangium sp. NPDC000396]|uniref:RCC1 domain-containing protein n=1 Tax=Streptosporangium sp. NPDC000396 TaxID=3366185 RepID=UPI0036CB4639